MKRCASPEGTDDVFILCRSRARGEKEHAMHELFRRRIKEGFTRIQGQCAKKRVKDIGTIERRIGRLLQKNMRASSMFSVTTTEEEGRVVVRWTINRMGTAQRRVLCRSLAGWNGAHRGIKERQLLFVQQKRFISEVENQKELYFSTTKGVTFR